MRGPGKPKCESVPFDSADWPVHPVFFCSHRLSLAVLTYDEAIPSPGGQMSRYYLFCTSETNKIVIIVKEWARTIWVESSGVSMHWNSFISLRFCFHGPERNSVLMNGLHLSLDPFMLLGTRSVTLPPDLSSCVTEFASMFCLLTYTPSLAAPSTSAGA